MSVRWSRGHAMKGVVAAALVGSLAACGSSDETGAAQEPSDGQWPVSVESQFGTVTVEERPERIISLLPSYTDVVLALDTDAEIVGIADFTGTGSLGEAVLFPWQQGELTVGDAGATVLGNAYQPISLEALLELEPDLILANQYQFSSQEEYEQMSQIAPTFVSINETTDQDPWQDSTVAVGTLLGEAEAAGQLVSDVEEQIAQVRDAYPNIVGATALFTAFSQNGFSAVADPEGPTNTLLSALGFELPEAVEGLSQSDSISVENAGRIDAEVLFVVVQDDSDLESVPAWPDLAAVQGGTADVLELNQATALISPSVLNIGFFLDSVDGTLSTLNDRR